MFLAPGQPDVYYCADCADLHAPTVAGLGGIFETMDPSITGVDPAPVYSGPDIKETALYDLLSLGSLVQMIGAFL